MTNQNEPEQVGVAVMGGAQAAYDEIFFQQLKQPESVDTDVPPSQREAIIDGIRNFAKDQEKVESGTEDHDRELFYVSKVIEQSSLLNANVDPALLEGAEHFEFALTDYLEDSGIRAFLIPPRLYEALGCAERNIGRDALILVFDAPFEDEESGE